MTDVIAKFSALRAGVLKFSGRRIGNIAVGTGFVNYFRSFSPKTNSKVQFEFLACKGSREAFFSLCSQYVFR